MMNFDGMKVVAFALMGLALLACDGPTPERLTPAEEIEQLESKVHDLEARLLELDLAFQDVRAAVFTLGYEIEDFSSENWKTNVPDVEYEFVELKRLAAEMEKKF